MSGEHDRGREPGHEELARLARQEAEHVPPEVAERLAAMRREAVAELDRRQVAAHRDTVAHPDAVWEWRSPWVIGALVGTAAVAVLTVALLMPRGGEPDPGALLMADADELAAMAEMEVLEDLEFLAWLQQEQTDGGQS